MSCTGYDVVTANFQVLIQAVFILYLRSCWLLSLETFVNWLQLDSLLQGRRGHFQGRRNLLQGRRSVFNSFLQAKGSVSDVSGQHVPHMASQLLLWQQHVECFMWYLDCD